MSSARRAAALLACAVALTGCAGKTGGGPQIPLATVSGTPLTRAQAEAAYQPLADDIAAGLRAEFGALTVSQPGRQDHGWSGCGDQIGPTVISGLPGADSTPSRAESRIRAALAQHGFSEPVTLPHGGSGTYYRSTDAAHAIADVNVGASVTVTVFYAAQPGACA